MEKNNSSIIYEINVQENLINFNSYIEEALNNAQYELIKIEETKESINEIKPNCDKLDYALAVSTGTICGIFDIFLLGKPGETLIGNITDGWFENKTKDFARLCGWNGDGGRASAIRHLENKFQIPYDQRGAGDAGSSIFNLTPTNHHFKSLAHNPTLLGLFFSIVDQFANTSHFVSGGDLVSLQNADSTFSLRGRTLPSKLFCAFLNWFGHLISDISGSSGSKGRGMGIPSPLWTWTNNIIAIKRSLNIPVGQFDKYMNDMAIKLYQNGYDSRFQTAQAIPVFLNEIIVRLIYSIRRLVKYFSTTEKDERSFKTMWEKCEPFNNSSIKRMLTVAHATFFAIDSADAVIRSFIAGGGYFNPVEFFMRLNIVGVGRFTISLFSEAKLAANISRVKREIKIAEREYSIVNLYIKGLKELAIVYDDKDYINLYEDMNAGRYQLALEKSVRLAETRNVSEEKIVRNKSEIDKYFLGK